MKSERYFKLQLRDVSGPEPKLTISEQRLNFIEAKTHLRANVATLSKK